MSVVRNIFGIKDQYCGIKYIYILSYDLTPKPQLEYTDLDTVLSYHLKIPPKLLGEYIA